MSAEMERNRLRNVLGHTGAVMLRLRDNRRCLKYKKRRKTNKEKKGKREAVRVGWKVICSQLSCAGGRVEREGEGRGKRRDEMIKDKRQMRSRTRGRRALRYGRPAPIRA